METTTDGPIVDRNDRLALERERQELAKTLFARGVISAAGLQGQLELQILDLAPEKPAQAPNASQTAPV